MCGFLWSDAELLRDGFVDGVSADLDVFVEGELVVVGDDELGAEVADVEDRGSLVVSDLERCTLYASVESAGCEIDRFDGEAEV